MNNERPGHVESRIQFKNQTFAPIKRDIQRDDLTVSARTVINVLIYYEDSA